ncbi:FecR family protein [Pseudomonas sp. UFMG81]|uniref:FecR family protein n=1 Tax=Pseudomonas sp. UFMG81 TaxID=2745936 RepID=UPI002B269BE1|nr:FecR domain-containing protein [Pseudomonas sp. UFMG81]
MTDAAMPVPHPLSNLSDDALDWQVLLHSGTATAADQARYQRWCQLSSAHAEAAREAEALWQDLGHTPTAQTLSPPAAPRTWRRLSAIAASLAMLMAGYGAWQQVPVWRSDYHTSVGQRQSLTLADGSRVTLNTGSALSVAFSADQRKVVLEAGEALFETVDDPRPFVVEAGGAPVTSSAAVFSVRRQAEGDRVLLAEGEARVGEQPLQPSADARTQTAWQRGKLIFNGKPLGQVLAELERYQRGRILVPDHKLAALEVSGVFDLDDPHALLRTLEQRYGLKVTYLPFLAVVY